jgi:hypothetical protein
MRLGPRGAWEASNCPPWSPSLWCRLRELNSRPSVYKPLLYQGEPLASSGRSPRWLVKSGHLVKVGCEVRKWLTARLMARVP